MFNNQHITTRFIKLRYYSNTNSKCIHEHIYTHIYTKIQHMCDLYCPHSVLSWNGNVIVSISFESSLSIDVQFMY